MAEKNNKPIPSVLAFEKKLVPSDGYLYGTNWDKRTEDTATPLKLIEKSVRGTISNRLKDKDRNNELKLDPDIENANLQKVDACALGERQDTLKLSFTLKVLGNITQPCACNNEQFARSYPEVAKNYIDRYGFTELARRYACNIANARFLWRNRVGAEAIEVHVKAGDKLELTFDALQYRLNDFDAIDKDIETLAGLIAQALCGYQTPLILEIVAYARIGLAQEVYPSEELVLDKSKEKGRKSKILYAVDDVAAMHSQKIGNALRTIDTWYQEYADLNQPIAIEPYGAVTNRGKAYRQPKTDDFYTLFDQYALGVPLKDVNQEHYVMAVLVRGGVFGSSGKE
ncbi:type I-F CRISPR-associated protein Csy3 [Neisseriaceae bacterium ESL0693]|nr:type I-F CRISPR-associated protein Csy3 [Neisseriaceae bacterium ESL0693]